MYGAGDVKGANVLLKTTAPTSYDMRGFVCKASLLLSMLVINLILQPACCGTNCYSKEGRLTCDCVLQMADFGLSRVLEANATHVSTFTYGEDPPSCILLQGKLQRPLTNVKLWSLRLRLESQTKEYLQKSDSS